MASDDRGGDTPEIVRVLNAYHAAMTGARTDLLDDMLDRDYRLVHITGYVQPKGEWLDVIRSGEFDYHRVEVDERTLSVTVAGVSAEVAGRGIFDATIHGVRRPWRLQFRMQFTRRGDRWTVMHARYTTF